MLKKLKAYFRLKRIEKLTKELNILNELEERTENMVDKLEMPSLEYSRQG